LAHRVLLVDDSPTTRSFAAAALEADGVEVVEARTGFEALKLLPSGDFSAVVTDINMPDINGLEVIKYTRSHARYRETPVIIISTEGRETDRERAMKLGANEYLVKPFTPEELVAMVRKYLEGR
jgi:two-component system chemotaxis response regulator CheY